MKGWDVPSDVTGWDVPSDATGWDVPSDATMWVVLMLYTHTILWLRMEGGM